MLRYATPSSTLRHILSGISYEDMAYAREVVTFHCLKKTDSTKKPAYSLPSRHHSSEQ